MFSQCRIVVLFSMCFVVLCVFSAVSSADTPPTETPPVPPSQETPPEAKPTPAPTEPAPAPEATPMQRNRAEELEPFINGYDVTAYFIENKPVKGNPEFQLVHEGHLYYFASDDARQRFVREPATFIPQFGGMCTLAFGGSYGNRFPSDPEIYDIFEKKLYLFSSPRAKRAYETRKGHCISQAGERWSQPNGYGVCVVTLIETGKIEQGKPEHAAPLDRWMYRFVSDEARTKFLKDPNRYAPRYGGNCAHGVSQGVAWVGKPEHALVIDGRLYFFSNEQVRDDFKAKQADLIPKANSEWKKIRKQELQKLEDMQENTR